MHFVHPWEIQSSQKSWNTSNSIVCGIEKRERKRVGLLLDYLYPEVSG